MYLYIPDDATEEEVADLSIWHWNRLFEQRCPEKDYIPSWKAN